jgi:hypothetical protein
VPFISVPTQLALEEYDKEDAAEGKGDTVKHIFARSALEEHSEAENADIGFNLVPNGVASASLLEPASFGVSSVSFPRISTSE